MKKGYIIGLLVVFVCVFGLVIYFRRNDSATYSGVWPVKYDFYLMPNKDGLYEINDELALTQKQIEYIRSLGFSDSLIKNSPTSQINEWLDNPDGYQLFSCKKDNITTGFLYENESNIEVSRDDICKIAKEELENADFSSDSFKYCNAYTVLYDEKEGIWCVKYKRIPLEQNEQRIYENYCAYINKYGKTVFLQFIDME